MQKFINKVSSSWIIIIYKFEEEKKRHDYEYFRFIYCILYGISKKDINIPLLINVYIHRDIVSFDFRSWISLSKPNASTPQILHNLTVYITNEKEREEKKKKSKILDGWPRFIERERKGKKEREKRK